MSMTLAQLTKQVMMSQGRYKEAELTEIIRLFNSFNEETSELRLEVIRLLAYFPLMDLETFQQSPEGQAFLSEAGDVLNVLTALVHTLGFTLDEAMEMNKQKLLTRGMYKQEGKTNVDG